MYALVISFLLTASLPLADPSYFAYNSPQCLGRSLLRGNPLPLMVVTNVPPCAWRAGDAAVVEAGRYVTHYNPYHGDRSSNLELAAGRLDGVMLLPGVVLSYNEAVGERTSERGFKKANVIVPNGYEEGIGGGICQGASTVHAAAFYAGLDIIERHPHRFRVKYIPPGLDATVDYGAKDLRIRNNTPFPVVFHVGRIGDADLVVRVMAPVKVYGVRYKYQVIKETPSDVVRFEVGEDTRDILKFYGRPGLKIKRIAYRRNLLTDRRHRIWLADCDYEPSPWTLRVDQLPPGGKQMARGLSRSEIAGLLHGSRYTLDQARFPDVDRDNNRYLPLSPFGEKQMARYRRFSDPEPLAAAE